MVRLLTCSTTDEPEMFYDRASMPYSHSDQFSLTVSDDYDDQRYNHIDDVIAGTRETFYAGDEAHYDQREGFAIYEDGADADAYVPSSCCPHFVSTLTRCFVKQDSKHSRARDHLR